PLASDLLVRFRWQMRREGLLASASSPTGFRLSVAVGVSTLTFRESRGDGGSVQKSLLPWETSHRADMLPRRDCARRAAAPGLRATCCRAWIARVRSKTMSAFGT